MGPLRLRVGGTRVGEMARRIGPGFSPCPWWCLDLFTGSLDQLAETLENAVMRRGRIVMQDNAAGCRAEFRTKPCRFGLRQSSELNCESVVAPQSGEAQPQPSRCDRV